jgi:hypothetical protein
MGRFDFLRRKKGAKDGESDVSYILKRRSSGGGMEKVMELKQPTTIDALYQTLTPGVYALHKYEKGKSGFEQLWTAEVLGEKEEKEEAIPQRESPFAGLRRFAEDIKQSKEDLGAAMEVIGPMMGYAKPGESKQVSVVEQLKEAKQELKDLQDIFPQSTTGTKEIPITGSVPAALVYAPQVLEQSLDAIEKRLDRWGLVEGKSAQGAGSQEIIKLPEKPKAMEKREVKAEKETVIKMPEKPSVSEGIKTTEIKEEKEGEEGDGGETEAGE